MKKQKPMLDKKQKPKNKFNTKNKTDWQNLHKFAQSLGGRNG